MNRKISFVLVSIFILTATVHSQIAGDRQFKDKIFPLSLFYSSEWEAVTPSHSFTRLKLVNKDLLGLVDFRLDAIARPETKGWSPAKYVKLMMDDPSIARGYVNTAYPGGKVLANGKTFISQQESYYFESAIKYRDADSEMDMRQYQIILLYDANAYTLTFRAPNELYDAFLDDFKLIASSIVVLPKSVVRSVKPKK